jgi:hypothetical protein
LCVILPPRLVHLSHMITAHTPPQQHAAYNPWGAQQTRYQEPSFNPDTYNATGVLPGVHAAAYNTQPHQAEPRYGASSPSQQSDPYYTSHYQSPTNILNSSPQTNTAYAAPSNASAVRGPRGLSTVVMSPPAETYNDSPPTYESGSSREPGQWGAKG